MNDCTGISCVTHRAGSRRPLSARDPARYTAAATAAPAASPWRALAVLALAGLLTMLSATWALAQTTVNLAQVPLLALKSAPGLVMLTMSRDHRLFYAAYNDASDIDGDGVLEVGFKPNITYYGYFVSNRCYAYDTSKNRFSPKSVEDPSTGCSSSSGRWHGNWLNWATTSRMDALRRVLYGGYRVNDPSTASGVTVLEGASVPPDSHVWGKEYRPAAAGGTDTYSINRYTPLAMPTGSRQHSFMVKSAAVATGVLTLPAPYLRVAADIDSTTGRVWNWVTDENPNGKDMFAGIDTSKATNSNLRIQVEACVDFGSGRESACTGYPASAPKVWKPTGVLHDYGAQDKLKFGLLTGSYLNNYSGGVMRRDIGSFNDEINLNNGTFKSLPDGTKGIAATIDAIRNYGFYAYSSSNYQYLCDYKYTGRDQGECHMWGAPVAEMMYEGLRYFNAGATGGVAAPTTAFVTGVAGATSPDAQLGLPTKTSWQNPYRPKATGGNPICARPVQMVIADPLT